MEYYKQEGNFISVHFPSVTEFLDYSPSSATTSLRNCKNFDRYLNGTKNERTAKGTWLGPTVKDSIDVKNKALLGDRELYIGTLKEMIAKLKVATGRYDATNKDKIKAKRRKPEYRGAGDELDIHRVYQGQLDKAWRTTKIVEHDKSTKYITLFVMINGNGTMSCEETLWRAAAACLLYEDLQKAGKTVQIVVGGPSTQVTNSHHSMCVSIVAKRFNEKLSLERLAAMTHLGFYRTFCFAAKHVQPYDVKTGLGRSVGMGKHFVPLQFRPEIEAGTMKMFTVPAFASLDSAAFAINRLSDEFNGSEHAKLH